MLVSTPFLPLLLPSGAPPFRSAHITGLLFSRLTVVYDAPGFVVFLLTGSCAIPLLADR